MSANTIRKKETRGKIVVINITDSAWATFDIDKDFLSWMKENI